MDVRVCGCLLMSLACSHRMRMRLSRSLSSLRQLYAPLAEYLPTYETKSDEVDKMLAQAHILKKVIFVAMSHSKCAWALTFDNKSQELNCNCSRLCVYLSIYLSIYLRSLTRNFWRHVRWKRRRRDRGALRTSSTPPRLCLVGQATATHRLNATGSTGACMYVCNYIYTHTFTQTCAHIHA